MVSLRSHWLKSPAMTKAVSGYVYLCILIMWCRSPSADSFLQRGGVHNTHNDALQFSGRIKWPQSYISRSQNMTLRESYSQCTKIVSQGGHSSSCLTAILCTSVPSDDHVTIQCYRLVGSPLLQPCFIEA